MKQVSVSISNWKCLEFMFHLASDEEILNVILSMRASILRPANDATFLSCDQPVAVYHPTAAPTDAYGIGLRDPSVEVSLALSTKALLHLTWRESTEAERLLTNEEVAEFNRRTAVMAESLLFAPEASDWAVELVRKYRHCSAGIVLSVLDASHEAFHLSRFRPVMAPGQYEPASNKATVIEKRPI